MEKPKISLQTLGWVMVLWAFFLAVGGVIAAPAWLIIVLMVGGSILMLLP